MKWEATTKISRRSPSSKSCSSSSTKRSREASLSSSIILMKFSLKLPKNSLTFKMEIAHLPGKICRRGVRLEVRTRGRRTWVSRQAPQTGGNHRPICQKDRSLTQQSGRAASITMHSSISFYNSSELIHFTRSNEARRAFKTNCCLSSSSSCASRTSDSSPS